MFVQQPLPFATNRLVIFIITLALLWTQFFGLSHSVHHGYASAKTASSSTSYQNSTDLQVEQSRLGGLTGNIPPNSSLNHNCLALDACSLATAVFIAFQAPLITALVFFFNTLITPREFYKKLYWNFLSRAPPSISSR
jgi:hypothetical protein